MTDGPRRSNGPLLALLLLASGAAASAEEPVETAVRYFEWLAVPPNGFKRAPEDRVLAYARVLFANAAEPRAAGLLDRRLESLSLDPVCGDCFLYASAYASGRPDLKARAANLLNRMVYEGLGALRGPDGRSLETPPERLEHFFDRLLSFLVRGQGRLPPDAPAVLGKLLAELKPDDSFIQKKFEDISSRPWPDAQKTLGETLVRELKGEAGLLEWKDRLRGKALRESLGRLRRILLEPPGGAQDPALNTAHQDVAVVAAGGSEPEAVRFLEEALEAVPPDARERQFAPLYLAAYASGRPELRSKVVRLLQGRLDGTDERFNKALPFLDDYFQRERQEALHHGFMDHPGAAVGEREFWQEQARRKLTLADRAGRAAFIFESLLNAARPRFEELKQAAAELLSGLSIGHETLAAELERYAVSRLDPFRRRLSEEVIRKVRGPGYLEGVSRSAALKRLEEALRRLREPGTPAWSVSQAIPELFENSAEPEVVELLKERLPALWTAPENQTADVGLLVTAYSSGDPELRRTALDLMRTALLAPAACSMPPDPRCLGERVAGFLQQAASRAFMEGSEGFAARVGDFLSELGLDYDLFGARIEPLLRIEKHAPEHQGTRFWRALFERLAGKLKGEAYLKELLERRAESWDEARIKDDSAALRASLSNAEPLLKRSLVGEKLTAPEAQGLRSLWLEALSRAHDPGAAAFLSGRLADATTGLERWHYRPLLLAAQASGDARLMEKTRGLIERRILGQDGVFNWTLGARLQTPARRFRFYFDELVAAAATADGAQKPEDLLPLAVDFLAGLKLPYGLIREELEPLAGRKGDSLEKQAALELLRRKKGPEYASEVLSRGRPDRRTYNLYINGGFSPTSNFQYHEKDLLSFYRDAFKSYAIVLNAGGEQDGVVAMVPKSGPAPEPGRLLAKGGVLGIAGPYKAATRGNLERTLDELAKERPAELTVVYGGHDAGFTGDLLLWGAEAMTPGQIAGLYGRFPPETRIKSVFLQCFAGSNVAPRRRQVPERVGSLERFLLHYYPGNRCSISMSSEDELGQYYGLDLAQYESSWSRAFKQHPDLSMDRLKEVLFSDDGVKSSPVTTSDYFLTDLGSALCAEARSISEARARHGADLSLWPEPVRRGLSGSALLRSDPGKLPEVEEACAGLRADPVHQAREAHFRHLDSHVRELNGLLVRWSSELLRSEFPEFAGREDGSKPDVEETYARYVKSGKETGFSPAELRDVMNILATDHLHAVILEAAFSRSKKFVASYNEKFREFMRLPGSAERYKRWLQPEWLREDYPLVALDQLRSAALREDFTLGWTRKQKERSFREKQRSALETLLLRLDSLQPLRPLYRSIQACEASPLGNER